MVDVYELMYVCKIVDGYIIFDYVMFGNGGVVYDGDVVVDLIVMCDVVVC